MMGGDFNSPLFPVEKSRGTEDFNDSMLDLGDFLTTMGIMDIDLQGAKFT